MSDIVIDGGVDELLFLRIVKHGGIAADALVFVYELFSGHYLAGSVVERTAFFIKQDIPITECRCEVVEISAKLLCVIFGNGEDVIGDYSAYLA